MQIRGNTSCDEEHIAVRRTKQKRDTMLGGRRWGRRRRENLKMIMGEHWLEEKNSKLLCVPRLEWNVRRRRLCQTQLNNNKKTSQKQSYFWREIPQICIESIYFSPARHLLQSWTVWFVNCKSSSHTRAYKYDTRHKISTYCYIQTSILLHWSPLPSIVLCFPHYSARYRNYTLSGCRCLITHNSSKSFWGLCGGTCPANWLKPILCPENKSVCK